MYYSPTEIKAIVTPIKSKKTGVQLRMLTELTSSILLKLVYIRCIHSQHWQTYSNPSLYLFLALHAQLSFLTLLKFLENSQEKHTPSQHFDEHHVVSCISWEGETIAHLDEVHVVDCALWKWRLEAFRAIILQAFASSLRGRKEA